MPPSAPAILRCFALEPPWPRTTPLTLQLCQASSIQMSLQLAQGDTYNSLVSKMLLCFVSLASLPCPDESPRGKAALSRMSLELLLLVQLKGNWEVPKEEETAAPSRASRDKWKCRGSKSSQDDPHAHSRAELGKDFDKRDEISV